MSDIDRQKLGDAIAEIQKSRARMKAAVSIVADLVTFAELGERPSDSDLAKARAWLRDSGRALP
jgi:hypothetical protein